jgi:glucosamine-6-phosphate deaminase
LKVRVCADEQAAGRAAAREVASLLRARPEAVLGLATGHTMIPVYGELVRLYEEEGLRFSRARTFNLDEYVGVGPGHADSYYEFMLTRLWSQVDLAAGAFRIPNGMAADPEAEARRYENEIAAAGGIDLQLLGLGRNGHIAFNEPGSPPDSRTRTIELTEQTRRVNGDDHRLLAGTPPRALTMGIATILEAKKIVLVVTGWEKAEILLRLLTTPATPDLPASFLHRHPHVSLVADKEAMEVYVEKQGMEFESAAPG